MGGGAESWGCIPERLRKSQRRLQVDALLGRRTVAWPPAGGPHSPTGPCRGRWGPVLPRRDACASIIITSIIIVVLVIITVVVVTTIIIVVVIVIAIAIIVVIVIIVVIAVVTS